MAKKSKTSLGVDVVCEFLEVAIHQLLYIRDLYPASVFGRRRMYGVSVKMCLHPEVAEYISKVLETVCYCMENRAAETVVMVVKSKIGDVLEQFVFEACAAPAQHGDDIEDSYLLELEASLRSSLLRLTTCASELPRLEEGATFAILVRTQTDTAEKLSVQSAVKVNPMLWVEANDGERGGEKLRLLPINSMVSAHLKLQLFAQTVDVYPASSKTVVASLDW